MLYEMKENTQIFRINSPAVEKPCASLHNPSSQSALGFFLFSRGGNKVNKKWHQAIAICFFLLLVKASAGLVGLSEAILFSPPTGQAYPPHPLPDPLGLWASNTYNRSHINNLNKGGAVMSNGDWVTLYVIGIMTAVMAALVLA